MINNNLSPLYLFVKTQIEYRGRKNIGRHILTKALEYITSVIDNCCRVNIPPTNSGFLVLFYAMVNNSILPYDIQKLKKVKKLLERYLNIECC